MSKAEEISLQLSPEQEDKFMQHVKTAVLQSIEKFKVPGKKDHPTIIWGDEPIGLRDDLDLFDLSEDIGDNLHALVMNDPGLAFDHARERSMIYKVNFQLDFAIAFNFNRYGGEPNTTVTFNGKRLNVSYEKVDFKAMYNKMAMHLRHFLNHSAPKAGGDPLN